MIDGKDVMILTFKPLVVGDNIVSIDRFLNDPPCLMNGVEDETNRPSRYA
ncbi:hypothetical protein OHAE_2996 [Ochrobactrum soli]|uniref:Uncharacterized protein n=1 Tax=Ochrobactrum soli TaxID=2448455 RepID=A0A2P9HG43_9HYPH|nr:hypothetical protein OHAE_2996 [[Ochrobactrum] soli]